MYLYHLASAIKFALGIAIIIITYTSINVYEDPIIGIALAFLGIFIAARGGSFYLFLGIQKLYQHKKTLLLMYKDSYKLSLLFGIYMVINFLLIVLGWRNKFIGILLLGGFVRIHISLFGKDQSHE
ncbi:hypothetical protein P148_SR1C00001G0903 [candidate division SR1 bacterium RAAC1_SR1_1]|nr:hypothetical protein P148_SR1C00001G0903 [candidate division SR1 bacterium RAAC1_SR1_1]